MEIRPLFGEKVWEGFTIATLPSLIHALPRLHEELSQILPIKNWKASWRKMLENYEAPLRQELLTLRLIQTESNNLSKFPFMCSYQCMCPVASALDKQISVDVSFQMHPTLQISGQCFAQKHEFSDWSKKVIDFQPLQFFVFFFLSHFKDKSNDFQALNAIKLKSLHLCFESYPSCFLRNLTQTH